MNCSCFPDIIKLSRISGRFIMNRYMMMLLSALILFLAFPVSAQVRTGDVIMFGHYEQDNDLSDGAEPIEWQILAEEEGRILLLSRYGLDGLPYHSSFSEITWEGSRIRQWLNGVFLETAFTESERDLIDESVNETPSNPESGTDGGADTADSVFLLSTDEVLRYLPAVEDRICPATEYAKSKGVFVDWINGNNSFWWLRTPGYSPYSAAIVYSNGLLYMYGSNVTNSARIVRPALWLRTDSR